MLRIVGAGKIFNTNNGNTKALEDVNLTVARGEFVSLVGPSGCGKSTILNIIAGLERASSGKVLKEGREITGAGPDRVVMFQEPALFPWLRVIDNVEYGMKIAGIPKRERREKALHYLKMVHLTRFASSYIHELSGGMRQRVALARALAMDSDILLMDEPFAALDSQTRSILHGELQQIWEATRKTIIFVTHNVEEAVLLADRVAVMAANPGRIKREFEIKLPRPRDMENVEFVYLVGQIMKELKDEVEKVARSEFDSGWSLKKSTFLLSPDSNLGGSI
ncbi:MAG: ABC transporter ATP-binding protein [Pelotomaculum sp.]|uniref:ABC-type nitrate/sulfonate/bicarbonate transport system, ATPase component n=1 Tax=Pelotomaculum thermopropionicum (strain DSM 13744 / JCM 10971 / SI) TaxID=370438 RepID=A5D5R2_PELTS|nr:ABC transporter ATP-binding protein [Pelotomaculum sp.]NPV74534.1 ABC transporter ATP-binding protein [Pelotomaculum sp.]BAF58417.1 ABC-type nitrate/sulfonate/bicarbonate transport system, ATPase component [Pelotomaculum thermopropionicum SI]